MKLAGSIIAGIQGLMKLVGRFGGEQKIPAWLWQTLHIILWAIGFVFLYSIQPFVRTYLYINEKKKG
jgi:hypothetical protein